MKFLLLIALPTALAAAVTPRQGYFSFGHSFSTGPVATSTFIREATTTLILPALQNPHTGNLGLWPGIGTKFPSGADGHLIQGLAISTVGQGSPCNFGPNDVNWCIVASEYDGEQHDGAAYRARPGDRVTFHYKYLDASQKWAQMVYVNGKAVSTLITPSGLGAGFGSAMECQQAKCGTVPEHHWVDTTIIMDKPDPNYHNTVRLNGASGNLVTKDGGKTWTVADIKINQFTYT